MDVATISQVLTAASSILITAGLLITVFSLARRSREQERRIARLEEVVAQQITSSSSETGSLAPR